MICKKPKGFQDFS